MSSTKTSAAALFDSIGPAYELAFSQIPGQHKSLQWLIHNLPTGSKIVDLGCGTGRPACSVLSDAGMSVLGIDVSSVMLEVARRQVPGVEFREGDALRWGPDEEGEGEGSLDGVVVFFGVIANVTKDDIRSFFGRAYRWLRPGGLFVWATVPVECNLQDIMFMGREAVVSGLSPEENVARIRAVGFEIEEYWVEDFKPKGEESGLCKEEEVGAEPQLFVLARKR